MDLTNAPAWTAIGISLGAGAASFLSPCVAPLLPGYVAFITGSEGGRGALPRAMGFVLGFVFLFAALGATAAAFSRELVANRAALELVSGVLIALLGLAMVFDRSIVPARAFAVLQDRNSRMRAPASALAAMPVGAAFAVAWSPCIGPALAAILTLAAGSADSSWGATLLVVYGLGLGIPFVLGAVALERVGGISRHIRMHARRIRLASGFLLVVLGCAMATGQFGIITARLARIAPDWLL